MLLFWWRVCLDRCQGCFNILNMKINYWRKAHVNTHGWKRALEMLVIAFITSLLVVR